MCYSCCAVDAIAGHCVSAGCPGVHLQGYRSPWARSAFGQGVAGRRGCVAGSPPHPGPPGLQLSLRTLHGMSHSRSAYIYSGTPIAAKRMRKSIAVQLVCSKPFIKHSTAQHSSCRFTVMRVRYGLQSSWCGFALSEHSASSLVPLFLHLCCLCHVDSSQSKTWIAD